jgi:hypothetical protein
MELLPDPKPPAPGNNAPSFTLDLLQDRRLLKPDGLNGGLEGLQGAAVGDLKGGIPPVNVPQINSYFLAWNLGCVQGTPFLSG